MDVLSITPPFLFPFFTRRPPSLSVLSTNST
jgi:hypothetical protein